MNFLRTYAYVDVMLSHTHRADGSRWWVLEDRDCDTVRLITTLYIGLIVIFILCLTASVICGVLGCVLTCCLKYCIPKVGTYSNIHLLYIYIYMYSSKCNILLYIYIYVEYAVIFLRGTTILIINVSMCILCAWS